MKIIEMILNPNDIGVFAIGVVKDPAIEQGAVYLNKEHKLLMAKEKERGVFMGAVLIPHKQILRMDEKGEPYYIWFSKDTIRLASEGFLINGKQGKFTKEHEAPVKGLHMVESWIVESDNDKAYTYFSKEEVPVGTWMASVKLDNEQVKAQVKDGELTGFSIEGVFTENIDLSLEQKLEMLLK